ncbi:ABC-three component system middle component 6 [Carnobacterium divergens]|uniref:ABC-three component system middle component 6 n=1 Tax=Carnobacterium divergens TaxID=2748 RepID=UPI0039AF6217
MNEVKNGTKIEILFYFLDILKNSQSDISCISFKEDIDFNLIEEEISMLISKDTDPTESLFYIAGCLLVLCKSHVETISPEDLYKIMLTNYKLDISFSQYCLALDFLYLIGKIQIEGGVLNYVH